MLGVIRILAGLLVVYVHLAYSYDLQEFMGRNAWMSLEYANQSRWERPFPAPPSSWNVSEEISVYTPPAPDIRASSWTSCGGSRKIRRSSPRCWPGWIRRRRRPGGISQPELPPGLAVPAYVLNLPYLENHPRGKQAVAHYLRELGKLPPAERERCLSSLNEWRIDPATLKLAAAPSACPRGRSGTTSLSRAG